MVHTLDAQSAYMTGSTLWSWKTNCGGDNCDPGVWATYFPAGRPPTGVIPQTGPVIPERAWLLSQTAVRGAVGEMIGHGWNRTSRSFWAFMNVSSAAFGRLQSHTTPHIDGRPPSGATVERRLGGSSGDGDFITVTAASYDPSMPLRFSANGTLTELYIPASVPFAVSVMGSAVVNSSVTWPDGSRSVYIQPVGAGLYGLMVWNSSSAADDGVTSVVKDLIRQASSPSGQGSQAATAQLLSLLRSSSAASRAASASGYRSSPPSPLPHPVDLSHQAYLFEPCRLMAEEIRATSSGNDMGGGGGLPSPPLRSLQSCMAAAYTQWMTLNVQQAMGRAGISF